MLLDTATLSVCGDNYTLHEVRADIAVSDQPLPLIATANTDLAYVIFTSGSTGKPKGVMIDHLGALNTVVDINERYRVDHTDAIYGISNLNFDLSVYDIFGPLSVGGRLILPTSDRRQDPSFWVEDMVQHGVTLWNSVPAFPQMLAEYAAQQKIELSLRVILMSGDWIPIDLPAALRQICPQAELVSLGGATEASIWSIYYPIGDVAAEWRSIPYGRALKNQSFHVFKEDLTAAPIGVEGDLYIGGIGLAQGYWHDTERTNASFITHKENGERFYRTGDRGCWLENMQIEFLGRRDQQVKIQGHRIELGEIEANLKSLRGVSDAVVSAIEYQTGTQLVAYIIPEQQAQMAKSRQIKLQIHGVRQIENNSVTLPTINIAKRLEVTLNTASASHGVPLGFAKLAESLALFHRQVFGAYPKAKALYPSAGHLYPVQLYLYWPGDKKESELASGYYFYHPLNNQLQLVRAAKPNLQRPAELLFCADRQVIDPVYEELAEEFCKLELGYMLGLLQQLAPTLGLVQEDLSEHDWAVKCELDDGHQQLGYYRLFDLGQPQNSPLLETSYASRCSYREFEGQELSDKQLALCLTLLGQAELATSTVVYLYLSQAVNGTAFSAGWYVWLQGELQQIVTQPQRQSIFYGSVISMADNAAFQLLVIDVAQSASCAWRQAGELGQLLCTVLPSQQIGLCPIGRIDQHQACQLLGLPEQARVCHAFVGGVITQEAKRSVAPSLAPAVSSWFDLEHALQLRLPSYMCPKHYMAIEQVPLSVNGKVDRSQLPTPNITDHDGVYEAPCNEIEVFIQSLCQELLKLKPLSVKQSLLQAGSDSLMVVKLINGINEKFSINMSIGEVYQAIHVRQISKLVQSKAELSTQYNKITHSYLAADEMEQIII